MPPFGVIEIASFYAYCEVAGCPWLSDSSYEEYEDAEQAAIEHYDTAHPEYVS